MNLEEVSYSLGVILAGSFKQQGFNDINVEFLSKAFDDILNGGEVKITVEKAELIVNEYLTNLNTQKASDNLEQGRIFLEENKTKENIITTESGLQYEILTNTEGYKPVKEDKVVTHYHGTLIDGTVFDSSVERGQPVVLPVGSVISGWSEALQLMSIGSKWRLFLPSNLAYAEHGAGGSIGPNMTLIFEVELIGVQ